MMSDDECLHALFEEGAYAEPDSDGWDYILRDPSGDHVRISGEIIDRLNGQGLVSSSGGRVRVTPEGVTWLHLYYDVPVWRPGR